MNTTEDTANETFSHSLKHLGAAWARYGLRIGSLALDVEARHLEACGKALGEALAGTAKALATMADAMATADARADHDAPGGGVVDTEGHEVSPGERA